MDSIEPEALTHMRKISRPGKFWAVYQNVAMDSANFGHLQFLLCGAYCTFAEPPVTYPADNAFGMGWRYRSVGTVNLETGEIIKNE